MLPDEPAPARRISPLHQLGRHQLVSLFTTAVDYAVMIVAVTVLGLDPVTGTVLGAGIGAITNFLIGRHFTFRAHGQAIPGQALRYLVIATASLGLNAFGEHLLAVDAEMQYIVARVIVGLAVSLLWNFPMQRYYVFRRP